MLSVAVVGDGVSGDRFIAERGPGRLPGVARRPDPRHHGSDSPILSFSAGTPKPGMNHAIGADFTRAAVIADRWDLGC